MIIDEHPASGCPEVSSQLAVRTMKSTKNTDLLKEHKENVI